MNRLVEIITSEDDAVRNLSLDSVCRDASLGELQQPCGALEAFRRSSENLYHRVRALFFLASIHRYYTPPKLPRSQQGLIPLAGYSLLLERRFGEAIDAF